MYMRRVVERIWYTQNHPGRWLLWPFTWFYLLLSGLYRFYVRRYQRQSLIVPVIVVGNLTVGGVGKTPCVIALAQALKARQLRVGIVSRGYGARVRQFPHLVSPDDAAEWVGDEPLLLAQKTHCPVVISPHRADAVRYLLAQYPCDYVISDDGLQHDALARVIEIVVVDGERRFGNGFCLPAGPLRESIDRLNTVDFVVVNGGDASVYPRGYRMDYVPQLLVQLTTGQRCSVGELSGQIAAVAAIGYPERFFACLRALGVTFRPYSFADHHVFQPKELFLPEDIIIMTEKDAVKCRPFATDAMYFLPIEATLPRDFWEALWSHEQLQS